MSLGYIVNRLLFENHDLQVRFRWGRNDLAIWDKYDIYFMKKMGDMLTLVCLVGRFIILLPSE